MPQPVRGASSRSLDAGTGDRIGVLSAARRHLHLDGTPVSLGLRSGPVTVLAVPDEAELRRRAPVADASDGVQPAGTALVDRVLLRALWELPRGEPVPRAEVPGWVLDALGAVGRWALDAAVADDGATLRRLAGPPVRLAGALAAGPDPARSLRAVCRLSALCPMVLVVGAGHGSAHPAVLEAGLYGVGVVVDGEGGADIVARPAPVAPTEGPFSWWISELVYAALLRRRRPAGGPAAPRR